MKNRRKFKEICRLRTSDLMVSKMDCIESIALLKSLKLGLIGLIGIFVGQIVNTIYAGHSLQVADYVSAILVVFFVVEYLFVNTLEARSASQKELICDLLTLRMSMTGKKKS